VRTECNNDVRLQGQLTDHDDRGAVPDPLHRRSLQNAKNAMTDPEFRIRLRRDELAQSCTSIVWRLGPAVMQFHQDDIRPCRSLILQTTVPK
jgi:hypothetical protein